MMVLNEKGQFWSLDMVLAAVLFTLALGVVISQSEWWVLQTQENDNMTNLQTASKLLGNALVSKPEIFLVIPLTDTNENIRCRIDQNKQPFDLSWVENCLVNPTVSLELTPESLGFPSGVYGINFEDGVGNMLPNISSDPIPSDRPVLSVRRVVMVLPSNPTVDFIWSCMQDGCDPSVDTVTLTVWRLDV